MKKLYFLLGIILVFPIASMAQQLVGIDEIAPFSEGLAAVRKGNQWGFINEEGVLVIDFRDDLHWNKDADPAKLDVAGVRYPVFSEGRCLITKKVEDGIPLYGFIDTGGNTVIAPQFLNVYPFKDNYTTAVLFEKSLKGENWFKLRIYEFKFFDVLLDTSGKIEEYFERRDNIQMTVRRYERPFIGAKKIAADLVAEYKKGRGWEVRRLNLNK